MDKHLSPSVNYDYFVSGIRRMIPATLEAKVVRHARQVLKIIDWMFSNFYTLQIIKTMHVTLNTNFIRNVPTIWIFFTSVLQW